MKDSSAAKESHWGQAMCEGIQGMSELWKWSLDCTGGAKVLELPELWGTCLGGLHTGSEIRPKEKRVFQAVTLEEKDL